MMPGLAEIYDTSFFHEWGTVNKKYVESASFVVDELHRQFSPKRLIDLGSGCGIYSHLFREKGAEVVAVDGVMAPAQYSRSVDVQIRDLTVPFDNPWGSFDLALCLDVAEHIPEEFSDVFLSNVLQFSDRLILSAAQPDQPGTHHVNTRPKRYWVAKLAAKGFAYNRAATGKLLTALTAARPPYMWMVEQLSVYEKTRIASKDKLPFSVSYPGIP